MTLDKTKISNVFVDGIDFNDAPDFVDAYIESADYEGEPMTEEQLDIINEDSEFVYDKLQSQLY
jgi:hypothetical protein